MNNHEKCYKNNTFGYIVAREYFNWRRLEKSQEWMIAERLVALAERIDHGAKGTFGYDFEYAE